MPPIPNKVKPEVPRMEVMRGDPDGDICIIAPPPNQKDYENGTPLSSPEGMIFHELMLEILGFSTQSCCVFAISRYGNKANKANTEDVVNAFSKMVSLNQFRMVLTVGDDAFKFAFGRGKKPSPSLFGHVMYVPETGHKPLFAFPELLGLAVRIPDDLRTRAKVLDWQDKTVKRFRDLFEKIVPVVEKLKLNR